MAEAGNFLLLRQHALDVIHRIDSGLVDGLKDMKHGLVGAAMQRPFQGANRRGHGGMHIGKRGRHHPGSEGGGVEFVVGVQDEGDIEGALGGL